MAKIIKLTAGRKKKKVIAPNHERSELNEVKTPSLRSSLKTPMTPIDQNYLYGLIYESKEILGFINLIYNQYLKSTNRFIYYSSEDFQTDLYIQLLEVLEKKKANYTGPEKGLNDFLAGYFTKALIKTTTRNKAIDLLRANKHKMGSFSPPDSLDDEFNGAKQTQCGTMGQLGYDRDSAEKAIDATIDVLDFLAELKKRVPKIQFQIFECLYIPSNEYLDFYRFYTNKLKVKSLITIVSKFLEISESNYTQNRDFLLATLADLREEYNFEDFGKENN